MMATRILLTYVICAAVGQDVGNRSMRAAGRTAWNLDDYNEACAAQERLMDIMEPRALQAEATPS